MGRLRLLGLALLAVFALCALAVSTAAAEEKTKMLPEGTPTNPVLFLLDQEGTGKLELKGGSAVECTSAHGDGNAESANLGKLIIDFKGCTSILSTVCTSTTAKETGEINFEGTFHFWLALRESKLVGAIVGLFGEIKFTCAKGIISEKVTVEPGCAAGEVDEGELNKLVESFYTLYHQTKGVQAITEVLPEESTKEIKCITEAKIGSGALEQSGLETHFKADTFKQDEEPITILLMNPEGL